MPQEHSQLFQVLQTSSLAYWIGDEKLPGRRQADGNSVYDQVSDLLRERNDAMFGIVSRLVKGQWVRDATGALPLEQRPRHDDPRIEANNALMRCLSRLRPIDYAIAKKHGDASTGLRSQLKEEFARLSTGLFAINNIQQSEQRKLANIKKLEARFNNWLVRALHEAELTDGCKTEQDARKLLFHYRNLSSLMMPARTMVTISLDAARNVTQRETQYPVTRKTALQKEAVADLRKQETKPDRQQRNSHNVRNMAFQEADALFADLIAADDRALPAQARKTHLVGAKNAFIVKNELLFADGSTETLWLARMGSPAYVGPGERSDVVQQHTRENLEQIRNTARDLGCAQQLRAQSVASSSSNTGTLRLHVTCLNTDTFLQDQDIIVDNLKTALEASGDMMTYAPTNMQGLTEDIMVAASLYTDVDSQPAGRAPLIKAERLDDVADVMLTAAGTEGVLSVVNCASGQDRTGTAIEKTTQEWMKRCYHDRNLDATGIDGFRARGFNAAEIATHHVHGSPGMKSDSRADNTVGDKRTFSEEASTQFYLDSAGTNKKNNVSRVGFLKQPTRTQQEEFRRNWQRFNGLLDTLRAQQRKELFESGLRVCTAIRDVITNKDELIDSKGMADVNEVLKTTMSAIKTAGTPANQEHQEQLQALSHRVSGKESTGWKALGIALMALAGLVLTVATPLLFTGVGSKPAAAAGAGGLALGYLGFRLFQANRTTGLAKAVGDLGKRLAAADDAAANEQESGPNNSPS